MSHIDEQEKFYINLDARRRELGISWREVCRQCGVAPNVITRLGSRLGVSGASVFKLRLWMRSAPLPAGHSRTVAHSAGRV